MREDLDLDDVTGKARQLAYADNRTSQTSLDFDPDVLSDDLAAGVDLSDWWHDFELEDLGILIGDTSPDGDAEPQTSRADELQKEWKVEAGQMWRLPSRTDGQEHRIICGDCTDTPVLQKIIGRSSPSLLIADPEYDADMQWLSNPLFDAIPHWLIMAGDRQHAQSLTLFTERFNQFVVIYFKQFSWNLNVYIPMLQHVCNTHYRAEGARNHHLNGLHSVIECASKFDRASEHPHAKHVEIIEPLLGGFSPIHGVVLDLFCGGGSTIIAAENLSRQCRAVEIEPKYVAVVLQRYEDAFGIKPELVNCNAK